MGFITSLLGPAPAAVLSRVIDETEMPGKHDSDLAKFEHWVRAMFSNRKMKVRCRKVGRDIFLRPARVAEFLPVAKQYGLEHNPYVVELNKRFTNEADFWLEFRH